MKFRGHNSNISTCRATNEINSIYLNINCRLTQLTKEYKLKIPILHLLKKSLPLRKYLAPIIKKNKRIEQKNCSKINIYNNVIMIGNVINEITVFIKIQSEVNS